MKAGNGEAAAGIMAAGAVKVMPSQATEIKRCAGENVAANGNGENVGGVAMAKASSASAAASAAAKAKLWLGGKWLSNQRRQQRREKRRHSAASMWRRKSWQRHQQ